MKSDHLKAAPCVSTKFLAILRVLIALILLVYTIVIATASSKDNTAFQFISQWNLLVITIMFVTMAIIQTMHEKRLKSFGLEVKMPKINPARDSDQSLMAT